MVEAYDFSDPLVCELVQTKHVPEELFEQTLRYDGMNSKKLIAIACEKCWEVWPCSTIESYRARDEGRVGMYS